MGTQSDFEDNIPLALTIPRTPVPEVHNPGKDSRSTKKLVLVSGRKYYRRAANRKNGETYFNLVKDDIIDSSELTITFDNGNILRKSDQAYKGKLLPGRRKIVVNQSPISHNLTIPLSLAGKRNPSPPKKTTGTDQFQLMQGNSRTDRPTQVSGPSTDPLVTHDLSRNTSGSSSSLNLNSWEVIVDDYFDDMTINNEPLSQQADSGSNQRLRFTGDDHIQPTRPNLTGSTEHPMVMDVPDAVTIKGSEINPILRDSTPVEPSPVEHQPRQSRPRRNVGPPKIFGDRPKKWSDRSSVDGTGRQF